MEIMLSKKEFNILLEKFPFSNKWTMAKCKPNKRRKPVDEGCCFRGHNSTKTKRFSVETQSLYSKPRFDTPHTSITVTKT